MAKTTDRNDQTGLVRCDASLVAAVLPFARSRDGIRGQLSGVNVRPASSGGVLIAATDGCVLLCAHDRSGHARESMTLPLTVGARAVGLTRDHEVVVDGAGQTSIVVTATRRAVWHSPDPLVQEPFPRYGDVFGNADTWEPGLRGDFDLQLLQKVAKLSRLNPVRFYHRGPGKAVMFRVGLNLFGLVMPVQSESEPPRDWLPVELRNAEGAPA